MDAIAGKPAPTLTVLLIWKIHHPFDVSPQKKALPTAHKKCPGSFDTGHFDVSV
ncbi:hypothetical protein JFT60_09995 [Pseudomonas sp. MF6772]|jgi:hypothetical protein|uniref:hypothetical protein n=1 Tax=Pseudomonas TaxID=286 RepID=UPI0014737A1C|nr:MULTISPECIES: hypothetical protein [Pseudomonas]MBJ2267699.1 hypothetical protein [Pseudomonas sp. MF6772]MBL7228016.1 hypothetical protein [Pseudomonas sp.]MCU0212656.1 hypothetical protein [Pseudomonas shahriarae]NMY21107.1 hypothetical protein [Pseudomonas sp. WS 5410]